MLRITNRETKNSHLTINNIRDEINDRLNNNVSTPSTRSSIPKSKKLSSLNSSSQNNNNNRISPTNEDFSRKYTATMSLSTSSSPLPSPRITQPRISSTNSSPRTSLLSSSGGLSQHYMNFLSNKPIRSISNPRIGKGGGNKSISDKESSDKDGMEQKDKDGGGGGREKDKDSSNSNNSSNSGKQEKQVRFSEKLICGATPSIEDHGEDIYHRLSLSFSSSPISLSPLSILSNTLPYSTTNRTIGTLIPLKSCLKRTDSIENNMSLIETMEKAKELREIKGIVSKSMIRPSFSEQLTRISDNVSEVTNKLTKSYPENSSSSKPTDNYSPQNINSLSMEEVSLLSIPIRMFSVGRLSCKYPSTVKFYSSYLEYHFHHPYEPSEIQLIMYYKDFITTSFHNSSGNNSNNHNININSNINGNVSSNASSSSYNHSTNIQNPIFSMENIQSPSYGSSSANASLQGYAKFSFRLPKKLLCFLYDFDPLNPLHTISMELYSSIAINSFKEKILPIIRSKRQQISL